MSLSSFLTGVVDTFTSLVNGIHYPLAEYLNKYQDAIIDIENVVLKNALSNHFKNVQVLSADKTLTDYDFVIQRLDCNGANRVVKVPVGDAVENHPFWIVNSSGGAYTITVKSNDAVDTLGTITQGSAGLFLPDGNGEYLPSSSGGAGITDGDKGDITVSGSGATWIIDNATVTLAKMANMATASLLGRNTAGSGVPEELSAATVRTLLGLVIGINVQAYDAQLFSNLPQNSKSANYTLVLTDSGKHVLHPSADTTARTFTIPSNASVPFPIGTVITFVNQNAAGVLTVAITTDTQRLAGAGTTGNRTLAANGIGTWLKINATEWICSGPGLT
ncbi:MAG TPA: hypothetical protein VJL10_05030 [Anaerolineales bacterium]|nr:hypothetical protein [Anaerolineales bacterium]